LQGFEADWESLVFSFIYLAQRKLPWYGGQKVKITEDRLMMMKKRVIQKFTVMPPRTVPMLK
jgi:hypothetical protein